MDRDKLEALRVQVAREIEWVLRDQVFQEPDEVAWALVDAIECTKLGPLSRKLARAARKRLRQRREREDLDRVLRATGAAAG